MTRRTYAQPAEHHEPWPLAVRLLLAPVTIPAVLIAGWWDNRTANKGTSQ